jgi:opacity protein-like surface antigen
MREASEEMSVRLSDLSCACLTNKNFGRKSKPMRKATLLAVFIICCAQLAHAQNDERKVEVFGGYSYLMTDLEEPDAPLDRFDNLDGFNVAVTGYISKRFGLTGDFSAYFRNQTESVTGGTVRFRSRSFNYLGGPQVRLPNRTRLTPFVHALAGVANNRFAFRATATGASAPAADVSVSVTDFSLALGGGLDMRINKRIALRLFQVEYNPVFLRDRPELNTQGGRRLDNVRFSVGLVFK